MQFKQAKKIAAAWYELYKAILDPTLKRPDQVSLMTFVSNGRMFDPNVQILGLDNLMELTETRQRTLQVFVDREDDEDMFRIAPFQARITIESVTFYTICEEADLIRHGLEVPPFTGWDKGIKE